VATFIAQTLVHGLRNTRLLARHTNANESGVDSNKVVSFNFIPVAVTAPEFQESDPLPDCQRR